MSETIRMISTDTVWQLAEQWEAEAKMISANKAMTTEGEGGCIDEIDDAEAGTRIRCADQLKQLVALLGREV